jgi:hypothetical protein
MELSRVAMNPYDFTLYSTAAQSFVLKVVFSEGAYKMDVERYFAIGELENESVDALKLLAQRIRAGYPETPYTEIPKADVTILK